MTFYVGQKVVCVNAVAVQTRVGDSTWPLAAGKIYTIRGFSSDPYNKEPTLLLNEILEPDRMDTGYFQRRFRPAVERKTDISIFTAMLNPSNQKVTA